jgi:TolA-binding protein
MSNHELRGLFTSMSGEERPPESAATREQRRARIVSQLRRQHVELVHDRASMRGPRQRIVVLLVAAAAAVAATAFAGVAGVGPLASLRARTEEPPPLPERSRAAPPEPARSVAELQSALPQHSVPARPAHEAGRGLEAINALFADAKRARREGRNADALSLCDELLTKYPGSVLAEDARVERFRALARLGRTADAGRAAAQYLKRYPTGFAAAEAAALARPAAP